MGSARCFGEGKIRRGSAATYSAPAMRLVIGIKCIFIAIICLFTAQRGVFHSFNGF